VRLSFFTREASRSLKRNAAPSFAAVATVLVTILVLGVFIPIVQATTQATNEVRGRLLLNVYLRVEASDKDVERVRRLIAEQTPNVKTVQYVSKQDAYRQEKRRNPRVYEILGRNPLPDTFRITPRDPEKIDLIRDALTPLTPSGGRTTIDPAIDELRNRRADTDKIIRGTNVIKLTMGLLAGLLIAASVLLIANTIRLSVFSRRREIEVMKLVGATDWFIRWPFVIEGVIVGALGGVLAILLLGVAKIAFVDPLKNSFALFASPETLNFGLLVAVLLAASVVVSSLGSGISLRRFLRV
jgi:cell division transport system permease protein